MTQWHKRSKRTHSGGLRKSNRRCDKKLAWRGSDPTETIVAKEDKRKTVEGMGSTKKVKQRRAKTASVVIPGEKKIVQAEILSVKENKANRLYTRKNIVTKGAIIRVTINGREHEARVTSRPGQHGIVQAVLEEGNDKREKDAAIIAGENSLPQIALEEGNYRREKEAKPARHPKDSA